ncbi:MAG TPA: ricin-type beta-trefoil lectin domain protein [Longimicrobium sp.]|jgi:hypothetical protein
MSLNALHSRLTHPRLACVRRQWTSRAWHVARASLITLFLVACDRQPTLTVDGATIPPVGAAAGSDPAAALAPRHSLASGGYIPLTSLQNVLFGAVGPRAGISQGYKPDGGSNGHAGLDFAWWDDTGTPVHAPVSGTVINLGYCGGVFILDDWGHTHILLHMTNLIAPAVGQRVRQGDPVGKLGNVTGGGCTSTGSHLHYEVRPGRRLTAADPTANNRATTVDPLSYLAGPVGYGARFHGYRGLPATMWPGGAYLVVVLFQNTGLQSWEPSLAYRLGSQSPENNATWGTGRAGLGGSIPFNGIAEISVPVRAPTTPGVRAFQWRMVRDGYAWFGEHSQYSTVRVLQPMALVSLMSGKCLDAPYASNGSRVHMWDCIPGNHNQRFAYVPETGQVKVHGEKCLDAWQARVGDPIVVHDCHPGLQQRWGLSPSGNLQLRDARDPQGRPLCLDIDQYARNNGAQLVAWTCHSGENHLWREDLGGIGGSAVSVATMLPGGRCMDAPSGARGTELHLWDCLGSGLANQRFRRMPDRTLRVHGMCVDGHNGKVYDPVKVWDCHGRANQQWDLTPSGELRGINGLCIDVRGAATGNGTRMMLFRCTGGANQHWRYRDPTR